MLKEIRSSPAIQSAAQHVALLLELPRAQVSIQGNPDLLRQAITNLLINACKYTLDNGKIWLRLINQHHHVLIQVEDTGIGIPESDLPHIFDRFYRVDEERTRAKGGTGLGLAIALQIVEAHGGQLTVSRQVNQGSLFQIELLLG